MSLTSQLQDGEIGRWCTRRLTGTAEVAALLPKAVRGRRTVFPRGQVDGRHWAAVGGAFGARLAALVQPAPPYYALHGLVAAGLARREWADEQAAHYPTHAGLGAAQRGKALDVRPTVTGWLDLVPGAEPSAQRSELQAIVSNTLGTRSGPEIALPAEPVLADFLERTRTYVERHAPLGQLGTPGAEAGLARSYWLLEMFESVYRSGVVDESMHQVFRPGVPTVEVMRAAASEPVVEELARLAEQTQSYGALAELRRLAGNPAPGQPLGIAGPVLVNHWADGDLLISGPEGATLIDVKTVVKTDRPDRSSRWLWQLLCYAWLDTTDRYRIRNVAFYFARHGALVTWPLTEFTNLLLGGTDPHEARAEFLTAATRAMTSEGARLPTPQADLQPT
ncbi:hypothetical protein ACIQAD_23195 [Streptomyces sp. NPDC088551]|uniref:hypothetical protein n=1 Tax=Streptomyces sp. NPDC088551 TaxID=3365863 RepID=UPI00381C6FB4